ncbi:MAG TPA: hypothetical protein VL346_00385 [Acidobacteriaceae bacterium]|jgi:hypothetical protein|nr:hypothetical protein [Acidobacteriaceae bacterium]
MKAHMQDDLESLSVPEAEEIIEEALEELSYSNDPGLARALRFLAPPGYQAIVELCGENGRSKRRNANASTWNPEEDEVRIYFERVDGEIEDGDDSRPAAASTHVRGARSHEDGATQSAAPLLDPAELDARIHELSATLAEAERGGHAFIALKWFRDSFLPRKSFAWSQNPELRQMILAEAILRGVVMTSKIPNPKTPAYPTTTIRLNRAEAGLPEETQRFRPIPIQDSLAGALDDDRGNA